MKDEISDKLKLFGIDPEDIRELTDAQRESIRQENSNLMTAGILYAPDKLIFTREATHENWVEQEFSQLKTTPETLKNDGLFIAIYDAGSDDLIQKFIDIIG